MSVVKSGKVRQKYCTQQSADNRWQCAFYMIMASIAISSMAFKQSMLLGFASLWLLSFVIFHWVEVRYWDTMYRLAGGK